MNLNFFGKKVTQPIHHLPKQLKKQKNLDIYINFIQKTLAVPVIFGTKSDNEKFAGAEETYCVEALMQDGKALQAGTSHFRTKFF